MNRFAMLTRPATFLASVIIVSTLSGCVLFKQQDKKPDSELPALRPSSSQLELELLFVRLPPTDEATRTALWDQIDEQALSSDLRRTLARNGFRTGVIGGQLPRVVADLLKTATAPSSQQQAIDGLTLGEPTVTRQHLFVHPGHHAEIFTSSVRPEIAVLQYEDGQVRGDSYLQAQPSLIVTTKVKKDGRVCLEIVPEIQFGAFKQNYVAGDGMFRLDNARQKKRFDDLRVEAALAPGQTLILSSQPGLSGSLGQHFFNEPLSNQPSTKLLLIRLGHNRHDRLFSQ